MRLSYQCVITVLALLHTTMSIIHRPNPLQYDLRLMISLLLYPLDIDRWPVLIPLSSLPNPMGWRGAEAKVVPDQGGEVNAVQDNQPPAPPPSLTEPPLGHQPSATVTSTDPNPPSRAISNGDDASLPQQRRSDARYRDIKVMLSWHRWLLYMYLVVVGCTTELICVCGLRKSMHGGFGCRHQNGWLSSSLCMCIHTSDETGLV